MGHPLLYEPDSSKSDFLSPSSSHLRFRDIAPIAPRDTINYTHCDRISFDTRPETYIGDLSTSLKPLYSVIATRLDLILTSYCDRRIRQIVAIPTSETRRICSSRLGHITYKTIQFQVSHNFIELFTILWFILTTKN